MKGKWKSIIEVVYLVSLALLLFAFVFFGGMSKEETYFLEQIEKRLVDREQLPLKEITEFDWDRVDIVIQIDTSYDEGKASDIAKAIGLEYSIFDDIHFGEGYSSAFIFSKENKVVKIYRLDRKEVKINGKTFLFNSVPQDGEDVFAIKRNHPKNPSLGEIIFCERAEKEKCKNREF